ncbi:CoA pyrophosphatase [Galbibacter sp. EGI 63066]|uniref:NUDIX hydrolase n=1 Tax=Galbibacter sp. EGI 63066 TaxID=2993559 RepID=UPI002248C34C|nr:CoA pyrophosphatase [Galbibacter sp. EGI 63066]MCX2681470.1 CoA pyrophosphatase [Galbibacter sp. EGI 63066]
MKFDNFYDLIPKIKNMPLPGQDSHNKMTPLFRIEYMNQIDLNEIDVKQSAVAALFYPATDGQTRFLLILRKAYNGVHSNQVGFPGGKVEEEDRNLEDTALRETQEEVGVDPEDIQLIKKLTPLYIPPSNYMVHPFLCVSEKPLRFVPEEEEVEEIIEASFSDLIDENTVCKENITTSYAENMEVPTFKLNRYTVWGATAMMLSEVKEMFKELSNA